MMFVKPGPSRDDPAKQLFVRRPDGIPLSPNGEEVPDHDAFWHRRLRDGDVVLAEQKLEVARAQVRQLEAGGEHTTEGASA